MHLKSAKSKVNLTEPSVRLVGREPEPYNMVLYISL